MAPGETTDSLIESVTFNSLTKLGDTCIPSTSNGTTTITCNSSGSDYDDATYKLTINIETVQYNKYKEAWNTNFSIASSKPLVCNSYEIGDEITYKNSNYYVIQDSSATDDYIVLLKKDYLTAAEVNTYSTDFVSENGEYPYYRSSSCDLYSSMSDCTADYNLSKIKKIVDSWSNNFSNDLVTIDGYKARLLNENDITNNLKFIPYTISPSSGTFFAPSDDTPDWVLKNTFYWTMFQIEDSDYRIEAVQNGLDLHDVYVAYYIRPVINLKKSAIETGCNLDVNHNEDSELLYDYYSVGDTVNYNNENYCVIENSAVSSDYVTVLKQVPLTYSELVANNNGYEISSDSINNNIGIMNFYKSDTCYFNSESDYNYNGCNNNYNNSFIKNVLDNWSTSIDSSLKEIDGYKARLIFVDELINIGYVQDAYGTEYHYYKESEDLGDCFKTNIKYWATSPLDDGRRSASVVGMSSPYVYNQYAVRPVINLKKCAISNTCE